MTDRKFYPVAVRCNGTDWSWEVRELEMSGTSKRLNEVGRDARNVILHSLGLLAETKVILNTDGVYFVSSELSEAVICDIDSTLAWHDKRGPYDLEECETDVLNTDVADVLEFFRSQGRTIILLSGRDEKVRPHTERWLEKYLVAYDHLHMRRRGDTRSDDVVKLELYETHVHQHFNVKLVLDDRDRCVYLWRRLGLTCWQVADGNF